MLNICTRLRSSVQRALGAEMSVLGAFRQVSQTLKFREHRNATSMVLTSRHFLLPRTGAHWEQFYQTDKALTAPPPPPPDSAM